ncbi:hypothetical protein GO988_05560 [Hymenobacter sp. HMF4947]|uniref:Uncharacterized protein n=1 Tax=Hymenobacter ginkgonis TaxID=2682976 RepID=A0A7K1TBK4_9BACT|nr:hypothetical protein [Hymenobacter ginkgonis]MVN75788.1 hypothetical protein [Hymenobacter ginkgonis]
MATDDIDDLFRQQLGGHPTPPSPDLQQRLAELAEAERLDALFRTRLGSHASLPPRELWERLEDEHLRPQPRRRRVVAWWQYSAAAVLLLLLAGGAGLLWRSGYQRQAGTTLATTGAASQQLAPATQAHANAQQAAVPSANQSDSAPQELLATTTQAAREKKQKYFSAQATPTPPPTSSTPMATTTPPHRTATARRAVGSHQLLGMRPDAATPQLATTGKRKLPANQPDMTSQTALATTVAPATRDNPAVLVAANPTPTSLPDVIEVDVRRGTEPTPPAAPAVVAATTAPDPATRRPRLRLGGLLRQADHLVHGEPASFAEATGLPETVTVQARLGGRVVSKTIQL